MFANSLEKKLQAFFISLSTHSKSIEKMLSFSSCATTINNVPVYLPYNHVSSTCITGLQYAKSLIHDWKAHNRWWKIRQSVGYIPSFENIWPMENILPCIKIYTLDASMMHYYYQ